MATMENMTEAEVKEMKQYFEDKIASKNNEATFTPFKTLRTDEHMLQRIEKIESIMNDLTIQVSQLDHFIKTIFDGHVLIDGQFRKINI